jgi:hypothetical protein
MLPCGHKESENLLIRDYTSLHHHLDFGFSSLQKVKNKLILFITCLVYGIFLYRLIKLGKMFIYFSQ